MLIYFPPSLAPCVRDQAFLNIAVKFAWMDHVFRVDNCSAFVVVLRFWLFWFLALSVFVVSFMQVKDKRNSKRETRMKRTRAKEAMYARWQG